MAQWETISKSNDGWEDIDTWETLPTEKRKTTWTEDVGIGLASAAQPIVKAGGLLLGGTAGLLGRQEDQDMVYSDMNKLSKSIDDYWIPKDAEQSFGGKLLGTALTLPQQMLAMPFSPADTGTKMIDAGETLEKAQTGALLDTVGNVAGLAFNPTGGTLLKRIATNAGMNAAQDTAVKAAISGIADTKKIKQEFEPTLEGAAISGIVGGAFGALGGKSPDIEVKTGDGGYKTNLADDVKPQWDDMSDVQARYDVAKATSEAIQQKLKEADLSETHRENLLDDLNKEFGVMRDLSQKLGGVDELPAPTTKPDPTIDTPITESVKQEFEPLATKEQVNESINSKDYSTYTTEILQRMYDNKQTKIDNLTDTIVKNGVGSDVGQKALALRDLITQEQSLIESHLNGRDNISWQKADGFIPEWVLGVDMRNAFDTGGLRGGLEFLAKHKDNVEVTKFGRYLGELAQKLLDNPLIKGDPVFDPLLKHAGGYDNISGNVILRNKVDAAPHTVLHEVVHKAVNKALALFDEGKPLNKIQQNAAEQINKLFSDITKDKNALNILEKFVGKDNLKIYLENTREFVAYGLTDKNFQNALAKVKSNGTSALSRFVEKVKDLLGVTGKERSALDDVILHGETLIEQSDGTALGYKPATGGITSFSKVKHTPEGIVSAVKSGALTIFAHGFTAQLKQMMRYNQMFMKMSDIIDSSERKAEALKREVLYGLDSLQDWKNKGKFFFNLAGAEKSDAVVPAMYHMKDVEIVDVHNAMMDGYRKGRSYEDTFKLLDGSWNDRQKNLARAIAKAAERMWEQSVRMQGSLGLNTMKKREGWIPTQRIGDHNVIVTYRGHTIRVESYLSKAEAVAKQKEFLKKGSEYTVEYKHKDDVDNIPNLTEFLEQTLHDVPAKDISRHLAQKLKDFQEQNASVGNHMMQSDIISGYTGNQTGLTKARQGALLREAIPRSLGNYVDNIHARNVLKNHIDFLIDNGDKLDKTTANLIDFYVRSQVGKLVPEGSAREHLGKMTQKIKENIDAFVDTSLFGFHARDKHAIDRFFGLFSNAFYTANITMKPTIWIAQPLQALMSSRSAFKEGQAPRQVLAALADTMKMLAMGKWNTDPAFLKALHKVSQEGNVLHPQMVNEYNSLRVGTDPNAVINKWIEGISGHTISAAGDKASRFASFVFFYNLHKRNGLTGDALTTKAGKDTTDNMIAYGSKKMPAIYRELGVFGEQSAPLKTFAHGQMGMLIVDVKEFLQSPGARTAAPLIMSAAVMTLLGGAISLPFIAEYELFRQGGIAAGWWDSKKWPSASDTILKNAPTWVSHGALSATTGIDVDASMRYTSLFKQIADVEQQSMLVFFPHLSWGASFVGSAATLAADSLGVKHTTAELDKAIKNTVPKGWTSGAVDSIRNKDNLLTRMGSRGHGGVPRDTAEVVAPWLGTRSTKEAIVSQAQINDRTDKQLRQQALSRAAQLYTAGHTDKAIDIMLKYEQHPKAAVNAILTQIKGEQTPSVFKGMINKSGNMTYEQQREFVDRDKAAILDKLYDRN